MAELIKTFEVAGRVLQAAQYAGQFIKEHVACGAWGDLAESAKPQHVNVEHQLGEE